MINFFSDKLLDEFFIELRNGYNFPIGYKVDVSVIGQYGDIYIDNKQLTSNEYSFYEFIEPNSFFDIKYINNVGDNIYKIGIIGNLVSNESLKKSEKIFLTNKNSLIPTVLDNVDDVKLVVNNTLETVITVKSKDIDLMAYDISNYTISWGNSSSLIKINYDVSETTNEIYHNVINLQVVPFYADKNQDTYIATTPILNTNTLFVDDVTTKSYNIIINAKKSQVEFIDYSSYDIDNGKNLDIDDLSFSVNETNMLLTGNFSYSVSDETLYYGLLKNDNDDVKKSYFLKSSLNREDDISNCFKSLTKNIFFSNETQQKYGCYVNSDNINKKYKFFAPIFIKKHIPKYFVIVEYLNKNTLSDSKILKVFDLEKIGLYSIFNQTKKCKHAVINHDNKELVINGYGLTENAIVDIHTDINTFYSNETSVRSFEEFITKNYSNKNIVYPFLINVNFYFDYEFGTFDEKVIDGFYVDENDIETIDIDIKGSLLNKNIINNKLILDDNVLYTNNVVESNIGKNSLYYLKSNNVYYGNVYKNTKFQKYSSLYLNDDEINISFLNKKSNNPLASYYVYDYGIQGSGLILKFPKYSENVLNRGDYFIFKKKYGKGLYEYEKILITDIDDEDNSYSEKNINISEFTCSLIKNYEGSGYYVYKLTINGDVDYFVGEILNIFSDNGVSVYSEIINIEKDENGSFIYVKFDKIITNGQYKVKNVNAKVRVFVIKELDINKISLKLSYFFNNYSKFNLFSYYFDDYFFLYDKNKTDYEFSFCMNFHNVFLSNQIQTNKNINNLISYINGDNHIVGYSSCLFVPKLSFVCLDSNVTENIIDNYVSIDNKDIKILHQNLPYFSIFDNVYYDANQVINESVISVEYDGVINIKLLSIYKKNDIKLGKFTIYPYKYIENSLNYLPNTYSPEIIEKNKNNYIGQLYKKYYLFYDKYSAIPNDYSYSLQYVDKYGNKINIANVEIPQYANYFNITSTTEEEKSLEYELQTLKYSIELNIKNNNYTEDLYKDIKKYFEKDKELKQFRNELYPIDKYEKNVIITNPYLYDEIEDKTDGYFIITPNIISNSDYSLIDKHFFIEASYIDDSDKLTLEPLFVYALSDGTDGYNEYKLLNDVNNGDFVYKWCLHDCYDVYNDNYRVELSRAYGKNSFSSFADISLLKQSRNLEWFYIAGEPIHKKIENKNKFFLKERFNVSQYLSNEYDYFKTIKYNGNNKFFSKIKYDEITKRHYVFLKGVKYYISAKNDKEFDGWDFSIVANFTYDKENLINSNFYINRKYKNIVLFLDIKTFDYFIINNTVGYDDMYDITETSHYGLFDVSYVNQNVTSTYQQILTKFSSITPKGQICVFPKTMKIDSTKYDTNLLNDDITTRYITYYTSKTSLDYQYGTKDVYENKIPYYSSVIKSFLKDNIENSIYVDVGSEYKYIISKNLHNSENGMTFFNNELSQVVKKYKSISNSQKNKNVSVFNIKNENIVDIYEYKNGKKGEEFQNKLNVYNYFNSFSDVKQYDINDNVVETDGYNINISYMKEIFVENGQQEIGSYNIYRYDGEIVPKYYHMMNYGNIDDINNLHGSFTNISKLHDNQNIVLNLPKSFYVDYLKVFKDLKDSDISSFMSGYYNVDANFINVRLNIKNILYSFIIKKYFPTLYNDMEYGSVQELYEYIDSAMYSYKYDNDIVIYTKKSSETVVEIGYADETYDKNNSTIVKDGDFVNIKINKLATENLDVLLLIKYNLKHL